MKITVQEAKLVWESPDKQKRIYVVKGADGKVYKSFSDTIGKLPAGSEIDVDVYDKADRDGQPESFIRTPKTAGAYGQGFGGKFRGAPESPEFKAATFALSYAKDTVVGWLTANGTTVKTADGKETKLTSHDCAAVILKMADQFYGWLHGHIAQPPAQDAGQGAK